MNPRPCLRMAEVTSSSLVGSTLKLPVLQVKHEGDRRVEVEDATLREPQPGRRDPLMNFREGLGPFPLCDVRTPRPLLRVKRCKRRH